jgi:hypothetical protein
VLSDNGKQFTGRFGRPRPAEVLFERICRENSITQRLTKPRSPTTTGKIERLHQTLQRELLNVRGPFASIEDAQAAVDPWRKEYNTDRPHQSLAMSYPAARFTRAPGDALGLRIPAELARHSPPVPDAVPVPEDQWPACPLPDAGRSLQGRAVELDRVHVLLDGYRIKTLPSRLDARDLARLAAAGASPAGPPPLPPASGEVIEVERTVNASGNISVGNHIISAWLPLAGQRVTVRLDGSVAHILSGGILTRTVACPVPEQARARLRGGRAGTAQPPRQPDQLTVTRRVSVRGAIMIGGQRIQVGLPHARKTAEVTIEPDTYRIRLEDGIAVTAPRKTSRDSKRHKASNYPPG